MLRYALRRVLWAIPTLLATSLVLFFVTTLAPDPTGPSDEEAIGPDGASRTIESRRARFLDLPRFFNAHPQDVRSRARAAVAHVGADDPTRGSATRDLRLLGGAALPYVLPAFEALAPEARGNVATALAPVAVRMRLTDGTELDGAAAAVLFWTHVWDNRSLDFTRSAVERAVGRLVEHGSDLREADLVALDTFALPEILRAMTMTTDHLALQRLTRVAHHSTNRGPVFEPISSDDEARRVVADWQEWWFVHASDYMALEGADRVLAMVTETRYGKWLKRASSGELGVSAVDGEPIAAKLRERAPVTLVACGLAMLGSWALAVPIGALGAWRRGRAFDSVSSVVLFALYATPTFAAAELLRRLTEGHAVAGGRMALVIIALAAGSLATLSRWQRTAMLEVMRQDFVRTAHAKGLSAWRVAVVHVLRNALLPTVTLGGLHLPALLSGTFVVEEVFGLPGLGFETLRAIEAHDVAWLMAIVLAIACVVTAGLVVSDLACGALDPRVRDVLVRRQG